MNEWTKEYDINKELSEMQKIIGINFAKWREQKGLTQEEIGLFLGVGKGAVWKWENGKSMIPIDKAMVLSKFFGDSLELILFGQVSMKEIQERFNGCSNEKKEAILDIIDIALRIPRE